MRLELEPNPSPIPFAENANSEASIEGPSSEAVEYLREGIKAAQAGNRAGARSSLLRAAELDPRSENAWLWLSSISEYPEELFVFLTNVLEINPENARALEWAAATKSLLAKNFVQRGIDAVETGQPDAATHYFNQALEYNEENAMAWLWLASLSDSNEGKIGYLERVLEFDPENEVAGAAYKAARDGIRANVLADAREAAVAKTEQTTEFASEAVEPLVQEAVEEITYELPRDFESESAELFESSQDPRNVSGVSQEYAVREEVRFSATEPAPFTDKAGVSAVNEYLTIAPINIDPEMFANTQNFEPIDNSPDSVSEPQAGGDTEMPFGMTMFGANIPMPADNPESPLPETRTGFETQVVLPGETSRAVNGSVPCPFCNLDNEVQAISCQGCKAVLTLADLEMLLANHHADKSALRQAVDRMEGEQALRDFDEAELTMLGIGHLNLRNLQYGYNYLHEASRLNPNNVVLASQVNALLIRLEEIKQQDEVHESMTRGKSILVVDDSPTVRKLIAGKLEKCGHDVFCSNDGVEAMERLEKLRPDLILLDINMPRMDGYQVCKLIRANNATKDVPVVMISGKDGFFDKVRGRMAGTSGYITKPFGPETLMKAVESYLKGEVESDEK